GFESSDITRASDRSTRHTALIGRRATEEPRIEQSTVNSGAAALQGMRLRWTAVIGQQWLSIDGTHLELRITDAIEVRGRRIGIMYPVAVPTTADDEVSS